MLRRAVSWREKQKTVEHHAALLRRRSFILKAVNIEYEDGSSEAQSSEYTGCCGTTLVQTALSSGSLHLEEEAKISSTVTGMMLQNGSENRTPISSPTKQPGNGVQHYSKNTGQSGIFHAVPVHSTSSSQSLDLRGQKTSSISHNYTPQDHSESEAAISLPTELNQDLNSGAVVVAENMKPRLQLYQSVVDWDDDSDSTDYFSPFAALNSPMYQDMYSSARSSDADKEGIVKMAEHLSLADEICEVEGDAEQYSEVRIVSWIG
jgi:hypothetical protein